MTNAMKHIYLKVQELPPLTLPRGEGQIILETYSLDKAWGAILLEKIGNKEDVCTYDS